jgi:hypothetical protein
MPSVWIDFVKTWASKNNVSYGCALSQPKLKEEYRIWKQGKKTLKDLVVQPVESASPSTEPTNKNIIISKKEEEFLIEPKKKKRVKKAKQNLSETSLMMAEDVNRNLPKKNSSLYLQLNKGIAVMREKSRGIKAKADLEKASEIQKIEKEKIQVERRIKAKKDAEALKTAQFIERNDLPYGGEISYSTVKADKFGNKWLFGYLGNFYGIESPKGKIYYFNDDEYVNKQQEKYYNKFFKPEYVVLDKEEFVNKLLK